MKPQTYLLILITFLLLGLHESSAQYYGGGYGYYRSYGYSPAPSYYRSSYMDNYYARQRAAAAARSRAAAVARARAAAAARSRAAAVARARAAAASRARAERDRQARIAREARARAARERQARIAREARARAERDRQARIAREARARAERDRQARIAREARARAERDRQARIAREARARAERDRLARLQRLHRERESALNNAVNNAWASASINSAGRVSVSVGGGQLVSYSPRYVSLGASRSREMISATIRVSNGYSSRNIHKTLFAYKPAKPLPSFNTSRASGSVSIDPGSGYVNSSVNGAVFRGHSPYRFPTVTRSTRRSVVLNFVVPSGYSNSGQTFRKTVYTYQSAKPKPSFNTSRASGSVSINPGSGYVIARGSGATYLGRSPYRFPTVTEPTRRRVELNFVVPSGYSNSGHRFTKTVDIIQEPKALPSFNTSRASGWASVNSSSGLVTASGSGATFTGYTPRSFPTVTRSTRRIVELNFVVPSGYSNSGQTFYKTVYTYQSAKPLTTFNTQLFVDKSNWEPHRGGDANAYENRCSPGPYPLSVQLIKTSGGSSSYPQPGDTFKYNGQSLSGGGYFKWIGRGSNGMDTYTLALNGPGGVMEVMPCNGLQDADGDGVNNNNDECSNTPSGAAVNAQGCAENQLDDDRDGVMNDKDDCSDTPTGVAVNARGCNENQLDDDGDGVMNDSDDCSDTPTGVAVNAQGCAENQLDDDGDGVMNDSDDCSDTPTGVAVNARGCAENQLDDDGDGVMNDSDDCSDTPTGVAVNAQGCAENQLDDDGDGVMNDSDDCANTPSGTAVNARGCENQSRPDTIRLYKDQDGDDLGDSGQAQVWDKDRAIPQGWVINTDDDCPDEWGPQSNNGCPLSCLGNQKGAYTVATPSSDQNYILTKTYQNESGSDAVSGIQYFDGLGRPLQSVAVGATPIGEDLVTQIIYDAFGRQDKTYLPTPMDGTAGSYRTTAIAEAKSYYDVTNPFSETVFEASPLNRVMEQKAPGDFASSPIKQHYGSNSANEVNRYDVDEEGNIDTTLSTYAAGTLYKNGLEDENENTTFTYTDLQGRVVLKRAPGTSTSTVHDTYYLYDDYGNLRYVLPPAAEGKTDATTLAELGYQYHYDHRNRLISKQLPGKGVEYIVYDALDRVVLTQDAKMRGAERALKTDYDVFNRVVQTGFVSVEGTTYEALEQSHNSSISEVLTKQYYDDYSGLSAINAPSKGATHGLPTWSQTRVLGAEQGQSADWITTVTGYDAKGRVVYTATDNPLLDVVETQSHELDFVGRVLKTTTTHKKGGTALSWTDDFTYDVNGRMLKQTQTLDDKTETIVARCYNPLGQLNRKTLGGGLQTLDYDYNIRGWLTSTNDPTDLGTDLFAYGLSYLPNGNINKMDWRHKGESKQSYAYTYDALNRIETATHNTGHYNMAVSEYDKNGNILNLERMGAMDDSARNFGMIDDMTYSYTGNRLMSISESGSTAKGFTSKTTKATQYDYDVNGNMVQDLNKGISSINYNHLNLPESITIDGSNINYQYDASGIKMKKVAAGTTTEYSGATVYKDDKLEFIHMPEGYIEPHNNGYRYVYRLTDHLGNTRVSFTKNTVTDQAKALATNDYYPFGLEHQKADNTASSSNLGQQYKFAGKELEEDLDLNTVAYEWRAYEPAKARFNNIDRFAEKYETLSPYHFSANNPIYFREIAGDSINVAQLYAKVDGNYVNPAQVNAFEHFANSKVGKAYLSKFASKGQIVAGVEFGEDGELHSDGFDINFGAVPTSKSADGTTGLKQDDNGRWQFTVNFKAPSDGLYENAGALIHEMFVHVENYIPDIYDDGQKNHSNMPSWINEKHKSKFRHHGYEDFLSRTNTSKSMWFTQGFNLMLIINKQSKNKTYEQVWSDLFDGL